MPVLDINLLRKEQSALSRLSQATLIVGVVSGSVVILMLLITVFLYTTLAIKTGQRDGLVQEQEEYAAKSGELTDFNQIYYPEMTLAQQAAAYQSQVDGARSLIDNHKYFSLYLSEIAVNTPASIRYSSFSSESGDRLTVVGNARTYSDVSRLAKTMEGLSFASSASIQDAKLNRGGSDGSYPVQFTIVIGLKSAADLNRLPGPDEPFGVDPDASPAPEASAAPSAAPLPLGETNG